MNKNEFTDAVAEKAGLTKKDAKNAVEACIDVITENLAKNEAITFLGFGTFTTVKREIRKARVPGTDKTVEVPATTVVKFKVGKNLKSAVANNQ
jgi:DNA-binding protein HU-beta